MKAAFKKHALDQLKESDCLNKEAFVLYRDNTASFAALAAQSSTLSMSHSALYDRDHPSMAGKTGDTPIFQELSDTEAAKLREQIGLHDWNSDDYQ